MTSTQLSIVIKQVLEVLLNGIKEGHEYLGLEEILSRIEANFQTTYKGPKYSKFKESLEWLVKHNFVEQIREGQAKFFKLLPAGEKYWEYGRYVPFPKYYYFLVNLLTYLVVYLIHDWSFLTFAAITHRFLSYFTAPTFFVFMEFMILLPLFGRFYLSPTIKSAYGFDLINSRYDLFHPVPVYLLNNNYNINLSLKRACRWSTFFALTIVIIIAYFPLFDKGLNSPGQYGIPINYSVTTLLFNLIFFPLSNFVFYTTMFMLVFLGIYLTALPLELNESILFKIVEDSLENHRRIMHVSVFIVINALYLALENALPTSPYPYYPVFFLLVIISILTSTMVIIIWGLGYQKLKTIKKIKEISKKN